MPRTASGLAFEGQSLKGMELDAKLATNGDDNYACIFAASAFDVQVAAATTSRQFTLNKGSRTSAGAAGEITATCDVFVVPDSPGQWVINRAFSTGEKVNIRRTLFGAKVGDEAELSANNSVGVEVSPTPASATTPLSGGLLDFTIATTGSSTILEEARKLTAIQNAARAGMTLKLGANYFFIGYVDDSGTTPRIFISPTPDDAAESGAVTIRSGFPFIGAPVSDVTAGDAVLFRGRVQQTIYTGTVTAPIVPTDAAPGDDGNDLSTTQVSFALDDIGTGLGLGTATDPTN